MRKTDWAKWTKASKLLILSWAAWFAVPASAAWQSTHWNMTPEQVANAMAGQAPLSRGTRGDRLGDKRIGNVGEFRMGDARFRSVYYYDANGLAHIGLYRRSGNCTDIYQSVTQEHGQPIRISNQIILRLFIWHDRDAGNRIRLMVSEGVCDLNYERLSDYEAVDLAAIQRQ